MPLQCNICGPDLEATVASIIDEHYVEYEMHKAWLVDKGLEPPPFAEMGPIWHSRGVRGEISLDEYRRMKKWEMARREEVKRLNPPELWNFWDMDAPY